MWKTPNPARSADSAGVNNINIVNNKLILMGIYPSSARNCVTIQGLAHRNGLNPQAFPHYEKGLDVTTWKCLSDDPVTP
jgi:hypothetical protein